MSTKQFVGFIGSRNLGEVPPEGLRIYKHAAAACVSRGYVLSTGAAKGADQLAAEICLQSGGLVQLYLPWASYESQWVQSMMAKYPGQIRASSRLSQEAMDSIQVHPYANSLKQGARMLMARNYMIIERCKSVIAIPRPPEEGGTAQGIRLCRQMNIPVYNLAIAEGRDKFSALLYK